MPVNVGQAVGYLDLDTSGFQKGLKSAFKDLKTFTDSTKDLQTRFEALGKGLTSAGSTLTKNFTVPILAAAGASLKAGIDFESAFAGVRKTVDGTEEELEEIRKGILEMTKVMPQSAVEISAVAEAAGQLGIQTKNVLGFAETMVKLGDATNLSSTEAATSLARFANITGMTQDKFDKLGSTIVALGNNLATTESEIVDMALNISAAGKQIGLTEPQILAVSGALSSLGLEAAGGGTAFSAIMKKIQIAAEVGGEQLEEFAKVANMTGQEFADAFKKEPVSAIQAFIKGLTDTERQGKSTTKILNDLGIVNVRTSDTLARLANANELLDESFELANQAWEENIALNKEAEQRYATTESQLKMLRNDLVQVGIQLSEALLPVFRDLVDFLRNVVNSFANLDDSTKKMIVNIGLVVAAVGPALLIAGKVITAVTSIIGLLGKAKTALVAVKAAVAALSGPIGIAIAAIAALSAAGIVLYKELTKDTKGVKELKDETKKLNKQIDDSTKTFETNKNEIVNNATKAKELVDQMYKLSESEEDTEVKTRALASIQEQLEGLIPGLKIEIDKETGAIKTQRNEIINLINSYIKLAAAKVYEQKGQDASDAYVKAMMNRVDATKQLKEAGNNITEYNKKLDELQKKSKEYTDIVNSSTIGSKESREAYQANKQIKSEIMSLQGQIKNEEKNQEKIRKLWYENDDIMKEQKNTMVELQKEQAEFEKAVAQDLGLNEQVEAVIETNDAIVTDTKETNDEIEKLKKENARLQEELDKKNQLNTIKTQKETNDKLQEEQEKANNEEYEAEKERYEKLEELNREYVSEIERIDKEYSDERERILAQEKEDIQAIQSEYDSALEARKDAIKGQLGLFDEFSKGEEKVSGNDLLKNLRSQVKGLQQWRENLDKLSERGIASGLLEELQNLGPSAAKEIEALTKLSDTKLEEYNNLWQQKNDEIESQAEEELVDKKSETERKIREVQDNTLSDLEALELKTKEELLNIEGLYLTGLEELGVNVVPESEETGIEIIKAIETGVEEEEANLYSKLNTMKDEVSKIIKSIRNNIDSLSDSVPVDGSHKNGLSYVPYDGYIAKLHEGERVLTKDENKDYTYGTNTVSTNGQIVNVNFGGTMGQLIRVLQPEITLENSRVGEQY